MVKTIKQRNGEIKRKAKKFNCGGRPKGTTLALDEDIIYKMASEDATVSEIASYFRCDRDTIYARYSDTLKRGREAGTVSLKRKLFEIAVAGQGNLSALIWLTKNTCGYRDKHPDEVDGSVVYNVVLNEQP